MLDKVLHLLGGITLTILTEHPISSAFAIGIAHETIALSFGVGVFDWWDIVATTLGGVAVYLWRRCP
jgi:hypothetical protein